MKRLLALLLAALAVITPVAAQSSAPAPSAAAYQQRPTPPPEPRLAVFDLDFPGGTPQQLVDAITKASGHPLNAIIPSEFANRELPPMRMSQVTASHIFEALSRINVFRREGNHYYDAGASFRTTDNSPSNRSVWYFEVRGAVPSAPTLTRYFLLTPYLERGLTVDDITTAILTGCKMQQLAPAPALSFHKETKLLIGVATQPGIEVIESALRALDPTQPKTLATPVEPSAPQKKS